MTRVKGLYKVAFWGLALRTGRIARQNYTEHNMGTLRYVRCKIGDTRGWRTSLREIMVSPMHAAQTAGAQQYAMTVHEKINA